MFQTTNQQLLTAVQLLQVSLFDVIILKLRQNCHAGCSGFHDNGDVSRAINIINTRHHQMTRARPFLQNACNQASHVQGIAFQRELLTTCRWIQPTPLKGDPLTIDG